MQAYGERARYRDVFAVPEFRVLWLAQLLSVAGDQLARVAMTVLVFQHTRSALWTAVTYSVTFLPWIIGGVALSGLADKLPRREVMIACDLIRAALVVAMITPGLALWAKVCLLFAVTLLDSPFKSARAAMYADILTGDRYVLATAVTQTTLQFGMVAGFALGGVVVAFLGAPTALGADAATFVLSALLILSGVRARPAAAARDDGGRAPGAEISAGVRLVFANRELRSLMLIGWLVAFYVVPQGLAAPYAAQSHEMPTAVAAGLIFAAGPFGTAVGAVVFGRLVEPRLRLSLMGPLAVAACASLVLCVMHPELLISLAIFTASGACAAYQLAANAAFVSAVPNHRRGQAFGLANGGMQVTQGIWFILAGAAAERMTPAMVIAISGGIGAALAVTLAVSWHRWHARTADPAIAARQPGSS
ncbi:MAG: MFS transporter [Micromonosporaceae bacterium]